MSRNIRKVEQYELDAYALGRAIGEQRQFRTHVVRREVYLDDQGRPVKLVEEVIETSEDI